MEIYSLAVEKANELERELKRLGRWMNKPLPDESFIDMGAFGSRTMTFEQWIQFVLIERIRQIIAEKSEFPESSNLAGYAVRYFDGDHEAGALQQILSELDALINKETRSKQAPPR